MGGMGDMFMRMGNRLMGATSDLLGGDAGDVYYPHYLINGKPPPTLPSSPAPPQRGAHPPHQCGQRHRLPVRDGWSHADDYAH
ncbi:hypothetical protein GCM10023065_30750 [Microbacterium laevaniformans]